MVAADANDQGDLISARRRHRRDDDRCYGVGDGRNREARRHARVVARGQRLASGGNGVGVVAAHPLRAQARKLGREHQEAVMDESTRECDQARIVPALWGNPRDQEQCRPRVSRQVNVPA